MSVHDLPAINASLNALAACLLLGGWIAIKRGRRKVHMRFMIAALAVSTLFLCSYSIYHALHGSTPYQGQGSLRVIYFTILITHIPLAGLVVPFSLLAGWHAYKRRFDRHVRITRWLWPIWIYVSVTGVLIYGMLYLF